MIWKIYLIKDSIGWWQLNLSEKIMMIGTFGYSDAIAVNKKPYNIKV